MLIRGHYVSLGRKAAHVFGPVLIFIFREFRKPIKDLIRATMENNWEKQKHAIVELEAAAELVAMKRARGG